MTLTEKKEEKILSVVIPAYNSEKYIEECILSIYNQGEFSRSISVIIIVDGANDKTFERAHNLISSIPLSARLIYQENAGPSAARNHGLKYVETDYVTFLDSDDYWSKEYMKSTMQHLKNNPDIVEYDAFRTSSEGKTLNIIKISNATTGDSAETNKYDFLSTFRCYSWARIYKTSLLKSHPFPADRRFEDTATTPWHYWNSRKIISLGEALIHYRQHPKSILSSPKEEDILEILRCASEAVEMYHKTKDEYWKVVTYRIFHFACQRTIKLPFIAWPKYAKMSVKTAHSVPPPSGAKRALQRHFTLIYISILYTRYTASDLMEKIIPHRVLSQIFPER